MKQRNLPLMLSFSGMLLCAATSHAGAQITSTVSDRHWVINARSAALADAYTANPRDVAAMYFNPASLSFLRQQSVIANYAIEKLDGRDNVMTENVTFPVVPLPDLTVGIGLSFSHVGFVSSDGPFAGFNFHRYVLDLGVSRLLSRPLSVGIAIGVPYVDGGGHSAVGFTSTLGMMYAPSRGLYYGIAYHAPGWQTEQDIVNGENSVRRIPLKHSLEIGIGLHLPTTSDNYVASLVLGNEKTFGENGLVYKGGVEVLPLQFLALRVGYWIGPNTVAGRYGVGFTFAGIDLGYAISPSSSEPRFHQLSLSYLY